MQLGATPQKKEKTYLVVEFMTWRLSLPWNSWYDMEGHFSPKDIELPQLYSDYANMYLPFWEGRVCLTVRPHFSSPKLLRNFEVRYWLSAQKIFGEFADDSI
jgi:hypothetical protein